MMLPKFIQLLLLKINYNASFNCKQRTYLIASQFGAFNYKLCYTCYNSKHCHYHTTYLSLVVITSRALRTAISISQTLLPLCVISASREQT